jgi:hypothetical protein
LLASHNEDHFSHAIPTKKKKEKETENLKQRKKNQKTNVEVPYTLKLMIVYCLSFTFFLLETPDLELSFA